MPEQISENKKRLAEVTAGIENGIKDLWQSDRYKQYLQVMSRFHHYSVNNTMLIYMQNPNASLVAGYKKWEKNFGRHVMRGEKGIQIIAPTPFKKKVEEEKLDPKTKAPMLNEDGTVMMEEKEITVPMYRVVSVFDVSQTDGKPLPRLAADLRGDVRYYSVFMEALRRTSPVPMDIAALPPNMDGYFNAEAQEIKLRDGMSETQTFCAAIHEITHATLHDYEKQRMAAQEEGKDPPKPKSRQTEEIEAESVAYTVSQYYGIDTSPNSFGYLAGWSKGKEISELRDSLETINKTAGKLIRDIDGHFLEVCKERGIDLSPDMQEALYLLNDSMYLHIQASEDGYDYTLYDQESMKLIDGGQFDRAAIDRANSADPLAEVRNEVYKMLGLVDNIKVEPMPLRMVEQFQAVQEAQSVDDVIEYLTEFVFKIEPNPARTGDKDGFIIREYTQGPDITEPITPTLYCGPYESCVAIRDNLQSEIMTPDEAMQLMEQKNKEIGQDDVSTPLLDQYPMPSKELSMADVEKAGYMDGDMIPLPKEMAKEYLEADMTVYSIVDSSARMCFSPSDIINAPDDVIFTILSSEWEATTDSADQVKDRMDHQPEREAAFLSDKGDSFAIYQLKEDGDLRDYRFEDLSYLQQAGLPVDRNNYDLVYTGTLPLGSSVDESLDKLWEQFNTAKPADFMRPSMSVSDIVAINQDGNVSCHYCDSVGFKELDGFLGDNPLKNAEMALEDDYGMIDGIINNGPKDQPTVADLEAQAKNGQSISLMDLADAIHREKAQQPPKRLSVLDRLKAAKVQSAQTQNNTAPKKSAEMEM